MSRTDKDRPWWVRSFQDDHYIDHDHRKGACIEETLDTAKFYNGHHYWRKHHRRSGCTKYVTRTWHCTKRDPYTYGHYAWYWNTDKRYRISQQCWTFRCRCSDIPGRRHSSYFIRTTSDGPQYCPTWGRVQCDGHSETRYDDSIPCICDDWPAQPTCFLKEPGNIGRYTHGGVPSWFVREHYHRPERNRERKLDDMRREYNASGDIEDYDFENRQGRNSCRWIWW